MVSVDHVARQAESFLQKGSFTKGLAVVHDFVEKIITEPICASQVFGSKLLDDVCVKIGRDYFDQNIKHIVSSHSGENAHPLIIYIVSRLQNTGGHLRLILDYVRMQPEKYHIILSTGIGGPTDKKFIAKSLDQNAKLDCAPSGSMEKRLHWLQSMLHDYAPENIFLFNHHQDSVAIAGVAPFEPEKVIFCHHGDHHLCLGMYLEKVKHIDFHPMGYHYCRSELKIDNIYWPLTFRDRGVISRDSVGCESDFLVTSTAARSNKLEIPYPWTYIDIIPRLLKLTKGKHIHIGKISFLGLFLIKSRMKMMGIPDDRFIYIEWVPSVWEVFRENAVDVYLASFPYGAGLTLIEAMGAGMPVVLHSHIYSRVLSGIEIAYPGVYVWNTPDQLFTHFEKIDKLSLRKEGRIAREHYEKYFDQKMLEKYFRNPDEHHSWPVPPLSSSYVARMDEWAAWVESQLSLSKIFYRKLYRAFRRMRRLFS